MWYLAEVLFAEPPHSDRADLQCESCNVVFHAVTAVEAYRKAFAWGLDYAAEPPAAMRMLGVSHLTTIGEELTDGTEICGRFFRAAGVWESAIELVSAPGHLKAIQWEQGRDITIGELLNPEQLAQLKRAWGSDATSGPGQRF